MTEKEASTAVVEVAPPLSGLRVVEIGHYVAAPFCTRLLGDLGADVIKVEPPSGDPARDWGDALDGRSVWWSLHGRNKRSISLDLKTASGRSLLLRLLPMTDVLVENFRPGQLERMGLSLSRLRSASPQLIIAQISGYGQTGPGRDRPAFGLIAEAIGGLRHLTNHPPGTTDLPPVRVGVSIGDSIAGLYAAFGIMSALWQRDRQGGDEQPRTVDVALTESVLSMMDGILPEYGALGKVRQPTGGAIPTAAPSNAYPTRDGAWVLIGANSDPLFRRLAELMGEPGMAEEHDYASNRARVANAVHLDEKIGEWTARHRGAELLQLLEASGIPATKVYTAADCAMDEQLRARKMVRDVEDPRFGRPILHAGIVPHFPESPGTIRWPGPDLGQHSDEVLRELLGLGEDEILRLRDEGVVA